MKEQFYYGKLPDRITGIRRSFISFLSRKADIDGESVKLLTEHREKGAVVFATFQTSDVALAFLYNLLEKYRFGLLSYAFDYNPLILQKSVYFFKKLFTSPYLSKRSAFFDVPLVGSILERGEMIAFSLLSGTHFLQRFMDPMYDSLYNFIELQRNSTKPIIIIPQMVFWHRKPEKKSGFFIPSATGRRNLISALLSTFSPTYLHFLRPVYLNDFIAAHPGESSEQLAIRLREELLEAHDREKRLVLGPVITPKQEMMEQILYHENVQSVIKELSSEKGQSVRSLKKESYKIYREIASDYKMSYVLVFEKVLDWMFKKIFRGIRPSDEFIRTMRDAAEKGPVIIVPNHRSHMDYLIITYVLYKNRIMPPHIAAGVNLSFFPLGNIFRHCGAFFIRRSFKNMVLYPAIFKQYLKTIINKNYHIEYFLEGTRSRTGRLMYPKPGLTSFIIEAVEEGYAKDVTFIPISICYDRILEEKSYVKEMKGHTKEKETVSGVLRARKTLQKEYGQVYVNNGKPFTLSMINESAPDKSDRVMMIGKRIMSEISSVVTITQFNLVSAAILCQSSRGIKRELLQADFAFLYKFVQFQKLPLSGSFSEKDPGDILEGVIEQLTNENFSEKVDDADTLTYLVHEPGRMLLSYYKNPVIHYLLPLILAANVIYRKKSVQIEELSIDVNAALQFLTQEFPVAVMNPSLEPVISFLCAENICVQGRDTIQMNESCSDILHRIAGMAQDMFESYYIVCNTIEISGKKSSDSSALLRASYERGRALFYSEKLRFAESLSQPSFSNAIRFLGQRGLIEESEASRKKRVVKIINLKGVVSLKKELADWFV